MLKLLLCWRYLRTRYIALASIISVMLGVATMIVVNAVMDGFTHEMHVRIHGILSDVVFESRSLEGFYDPDWHMAEIQRVCGDEIEAMTATVHVPAMLSFQYAGNWVTRPVELIGIDATTQGMVGDFAKYLQHPKNRQQPSFALHDGGYDARDHQGGEDAPHRPAMESAGWQHRRQWAQWQKQQQVMQQRIELGAQAHQAIESTAEELGESDAPDAEIAATASDDPFAARGETDPLFDPEHEQATGAVIGIALASFRVEQGEEHFLVIPGDDVKLTFPTSGTPPKAVSDVFTVTDFYESKMSEYDASFVFIPLEKLQQLRGMIEPRSGIGYATAVQIRLKPDADGNEVRDRLRAVFPPEVYAISTWRDKQGPLLAAVQMETAVLNLLLFLIIAVAGFGILAIFYMIVVEKTRDIGILKALGASGGGIMGIFLGYGLSLGLVGSGVGTVLGLSFVEYINEIADLLGWVTGREIFDPSIYYLYTIPTIVEPLTVIWIVLGAIAIAVMASILPARRAARLHPVEALRYE